MGTEEQKTLGHLLEPKRPRRFDAQIYHPANRAFHMTAALGQPHLLKTGVLHPLPVPCKIIGELLHRPFPVGFADYGFFDTFPQSIDIPLPQQVLPFSYCHCPFFRANQLENFMQILLGMSRNFSIAHGDEPAAESKRSLTSSGSGGISPIPLMRSPR